ncbi:MAG TPA: PfaD family polyunsaturated fatty acid/polyketide biosynthesis protein, partial [Polyangiaceae bacterium]|nr:PfaD family polyunsaturated fatty acid/polyketide biosynthesis protein [Polyangiaceae bacterium]
RRGADGAPFAANMIQAKLSRPEVAQQFLAPAPEKLVARLLQAGRVTPEQARLATEVPMADDICVESDSGGHTDKGVALCLVPTILRLRDEAATRFAPRFRVRVGAAGGIGAPEAVAAAFVLGADFVLTGSINQCTVEAGTSEAVKDLLERAEVQDTEMAPAGDMFELGARVQVLRKGLFFPARANKLYDLYRQHESLEQIDDKTRQQIEEKFFGQTFAQVTAEVESYLKRRSPADWERVARAPKLKMARVFQWYFARTNRAAIAGETADKLNFQIHCGPAMGACNRWLKGTRLEAWRARHVDELGELLMSGAAQVLSERFAALARAQRAYGAVNERDVA